MLSRIDQLYSAYGIKFSVYESVSQRLEIDRQYYWLNPEVNADNKLRIGFFY